MKFWAVFITIFIAVSKCWASDDVGDLSASFLDEAEERQLRRRGVNQRCARRLQACEVGAASVELPIQSWLSAINEFSGDNIDELASILSAAQSTSSEFFVTGLTKIRTTGRRIAAVQIFRSTVRALNELSLPERDEDVDVIQTLNTLVSTLRPLFSFLETSIGISQFPNLFLALQITVLLLQLYIALQGGALLLAVFAVALLLRFFLSTLRDASAVLLFPNANTECFIASMDCSFRQMMNGVVPVLLEMTTTMVGTEKAATP